MLATLGNLDLSDMPELSSSECLPIILTRVEQNDSSLVPVPFFHLLEAIVLARLSKFPEAIRAAQRELINSPGDYSVTEFLGLLLNTVGEQRALSPYIDLHNPEILRSIIPRDNPKILDIGCERAGEVQILLDTFPNARIYCFDPDPRVAALFRYHEDPRCVFVPLAIGDYNGQTQMFLSSAIDEKTGEETDWPGCSSICRPVLCEQYWKWLKFSRTVDVKMMTLDTWAASNLTANETVDLVWADVQGAEKKLIDGGRRTLKDRTKFFYTEFINFEAYDKQPSLKEILAAIPRLEYVAEADGGNVLMRNTYIYSASGSGSF